MVTHDCDPSHRVVGEIYWTIIILYVQTIFSVKQINVFFFEKNRKTDIYRLNY